MLPIIYMRTQILLIFTDNSIYTQPKLVWEMGLLKILENQGNQIL